MIEGSYWGKVVGGGIGFALGGPVGALFGAFAGHALDQMKDRGVLDRWLPPPERQVTFTSGLVTLVVKMARADGRVGRAEIEAFGRIFNAPGRRQQAELRRAFAEAENDRSDPEPYAAMLAETFADSPALLEEILEALVIVGLADGPLGPAEYAFLLGIARVFGMDAEGLAGIIARHEASDRADPYRVLGVAADAPTEDVKAAYRRLIRETHPDALTARGLPADFVEVATRRMAAINGAWERIKRERGLA